MTEVGHAALNILGAVLLIGFIGIIAGAFLATTTDKWEDKE